ncbi:hypothetical protein L6452_00147 [Arctium lappa]|uniref:Uncharacterized protein n=1 Tax=Arctium lappa TaxID=4217 RepID=A0ACB9FDW9_ARCLA|nr:hypothetical protein L6452_00147 [Arctium lappa]
MYLQQILDSLGTFPGYQNFDNVNTFAASCKKTLLQRVIVVCDFIVAFVYPSNNLHFLRDNGLKKDYAIFILCSWNRQGANNDAHKHLHQCRPLGCFCGTHCGIASLKNYGSRNKYCDVLYSLETDLLQIVIGIDVVARSYLYTSIHRPLFINHLYSNRYPTNLGFPLPLILDHKP